MLAPTTRRDYRADHLLIAEMVGKGSRVLDVGCGDGSLLQLLADTKAVDGRGIEVSRERVNACVARGLSVIQGDADRDLVDYPDDAFDYAILSLTVQATLQPKEVLEQLLRIGRHAIVSFPNFGHWQVRWRLMLTGRMPVTENLPEAWYLTENVHLCTIKDFANLCRDVNAHVEQAVAFNAAGRKLGTWVPLTAHNLLGEKAVFMLTRKASLSPRIADLSTHSINAGRGSG
jgi:methionine biosynthesis protein MetW